MRVLVIEDSKILRESLQRGLSCSGFVVDVVGDGRQGWIYASRNDYDVVVLDLMLPSMDGMEILTKLRAEGHDCHVLVLTARDALEQRVAGLKAGADDYLTKPFEFDELVARIEALGRRRYARKSPVLVEGDLEVDQGSRQIRYRGAVIEVARREFNLLRFLLLRRGEIVTRIEIEDHLYNEHTLPDSNSVDSAICSLRRKLRHAGCPDVIATRRGVGYVFRQGEGDTP
ncbi:MAG: response regulator transcription factor [Planctomycetes bacterium]|nr:response regulator transcription factor [Planctomycetota bacterium]